MKTKLLSIILCAAALFAACDTAEDLAPGGQKGTPLSITVASVGFDGDGPDTRTTISGYTTAFETGDAIGIFASDGTTSYTNKKWVRQSDGSWSPATAGDNIYYNGGTMTIKAYYPYNTGASDIPTAATFTVKADQSDFDTGYEASDLLLGNFSWTGQEAAQTLTFNHAMALLEVASTKPAVALESVTVGAKHSASGTAEIVTLYPAGNGVYRALLPAQTLSGGVTFNYSDTESYYYNLNGTTLTAGQYAKHSATTKRGISTAAELVQFSTDWNAANGDATQIDAVISKWSHDGTATGTIRLLADIDMSSAGNFTPIGTNYTTNDFSATFDGCGYTISNLTVSGATAAGLFGIVSGGSISRVSVKDGNISGDYAVGIAGYVYNSGSVTGCSVSGTIVSGSTYVGGIAGFVSSSSSVTGCSVSGGTVTANNYAGGIAGYVYSSSFVTGCIAAPASVSGSNKGVAAGYNNNGSITAVCYVNDISGVNAVGGGSTTNLMPFASTFGDFFTTTQPALSNQTPIQVMNNAISSSGWQWVAQGTGVLPKIVKK